MQKIAKTTKDESDVIEVQKMAEALELILQKQTKQTSSKILNQLALHLKEQGIDVPLPVNTPYVNTIPADQEPAYPGDREIERRIKSIARWNAMSMVVNANRRNEGLGGHISTFASSATLLDVGYNHFFRGKRPDGPADLVYFQGHNSPGPYARAFIEGVLSADHLQNFRRELQSHQGLSSYPHPYLMPDFWQFPSVSMGLAPITSIYQARFNRYLQARGFIDRANEPHVWAFLGDGECDEVDTLGALHLAAREKLDNLTFVINCNLQRLDGPVRGNHKVIQEMERIFRGNGWNVIKVIWGSDWDPLLAADTSGLLKQRMDEVVDGEYQKYIVEPGSYTRKHFFGKYPELKNLANNLTDEEIRKLKRGGHDPQKVYAAYDAALKHKGQPTVILAKTVKGYGLGEAGEGKNISHQQKKMNEKELREFRERFGIPISDEDVVETPFYRPAKNSKEAKYLKKVREKLGGFLPHRENNAPALKIPALEEYAEFLKGSGEGSLSTTMAFVRMLTKLIRDKNIGRHIVPIIPDEARTFGMETMFRTVGIYAPDGQHYDPVDSESLIYYREEKDGQILEEGINEAGSMSSFIAAGSAYATHGVNMIPFYIYYSMFGYQRVGDLFWQAADQRTKGFILGATAGRTALNGEGLQHQDGHSHIITTSIPTIRAYEPAFAYEVAVLVLEGLKEMYVEGQELYYYMSLHNENYVNIPMPEGVEEGIVKGMYKLPAAAQSKGKSAQVFASGGMVPIAMQAAKILSEKYDVSADIWSVTSYRRLRHEALNTTRWNMLHPGETKQKSYLETLLENEKGPFVAVSDNMKIVSDQIAPWIPGKLHSLGTDGFGRSDTRADLRRFFEVDAESVVIATLYALAEEGQIKHSVVKSAIKDLGVDPEKPFPFYH